MFNYYGSKSKIIKLYPRPKFEKIIEPFCGSARYSLKWFEKNIQISDINKDVIEVWKWLQICSKNDILKLPKLTKGLDIRNINISQEERKFLSFLCVSGIPGNIVTKFMCHYNGNENRYKKIAENLFKIRHWDIKLINFLDIKNEKATWFIDPPYFSGGQYYKHGSSGINYKNLGNWCKSRKGQAIVCENSKANWLKFKKMVKIQGAAQTNTTEVIWSNLPTNYDNEQLELF